jgi:hypothetical protein
MKYFLVFPLFALLIAATPCSGKIVEFSLDEMVRSSKLIIIGRVYRIVETPRAESAKDTPYSEVIATIEIEEVILGCYEEKQIDIPYSPRLSISAHFSISERCILFISEWKGKNVVVQGYGGKIPIIENKVIVRHILGEQESQTLKDFTQRIKDSNSRQSTTKNP